MSRRVQSLSASIVFLQFELKDTFGYKTDGVESGDTDKVLLRLPKSRPGAAVWLG